MHELRQLSCYLCMCRKETLTTTGAMPRHARQPMMQECMRAEMLQLWPSISASAVAMVGSENSSATTITVSTRGNAEQYHDECG
jgi:hypothetical protein